MTDSPATEPTKKRRWRPTRRQFLIGAGTGTAALALGAVLGGPTIVREARLVINQTFLTGELPLPALPESPLVWFEIDAANQAHLYIPKIEMGQGVHTALAQIAAEELELDWETVVVHQADTQTGFDPELIFTFGSTSVTSLYTPIREIAATMREMLRQEGAQQLGVDLATVVAENSRVMSDNQALTYGAVVAAKQGEWTVPEISPTLKTAAEFRYIGQPVPRVDFADKLTGRAVYGYDMRLPDMAYGAVARPPRYGATLTNAQAGSAAQMPGVVAVVIEDGFAGIVAETRNQAYAALAELDLEWSGGTTISQVDLEALVTVSADDGILIQRSGNVAANIDNGMIVSAEYRTPMAVHAHLEPQAALAAMDGDMLTIYTSTQSPGLTQTFTADSLGLEAANITVIPTYLGGGFGRKTGTDAAVEAARFSRAVGRPVHVGWNRTEDMQHGFFRPPVHNQLRAAVNASGQITAFEHQLASGDVFFYIQNLGGNSFFETLLGADPLAAYGSLVHYDIPHHQVIFHRRELPVPTAFWRGLGSFPNIFAAEAFMDEIAADAGVDPLELRLNHLPADDLGDRMRVALATVADAAGWGTEPAADRAQGLALAYDRGTVVALITEVSAPESGIRVHKAWCAVDPGLVVNPDGAAAQVQGSIVMALSSALREQITVENGMVTNENFNTYPLLTMRETPEIEVLPINSSDEPVGGLGEPVVGTVPAAVSNAVFRLTGQRLRQMPFTLA